jgi:hypothetical protein
VKASEWKRVVRPLLPACDLWEFRGSLAYRAPVHRFVFGVLGEGSAFDKGIYVWKVSMPLFVPSDHVTLDYSRRVGGGGAKYYGDQPTELTAALKEAVADPPSEAAEIQRVIDAAARNDDLRPLEAAMYALALMGDYRGALRRAERLQTVEASTEWVREVLRQAAAFAELLRTGESSQVSHFLDHQIAQTAGALGLRRT